MTIFKDAIKAFEFEHEFRCSTNKKKCRHLDLIEQTYDQEIVFNHSLLVKDRIIEHSVNQLEKTRQDWLDVQNLPNNSFAKWVDSVFDIAIKAVKEIE